LQVGAFREEDGFEFVLWAPYASSVSVFLTEKNSTEEMEHMQNGYWELNLKGVKDGTKYMFRIDEERNKPDPASRHQPDGVFGASATTDNELFRWNDQKWTGLDLRDVIIYELHVGTFTEKGTFEEAKKQIEDLVKTGINCIELMPVAQFSGERNWGYDGVFPYAVQNSYGGPNKLKELVDYCHTNSVSVILDVVYNHFGLEGNYLSDFGPYFSTDKKTPWGPAINFDGKQSEHVRSYLVENAIHWLRDFHIDGLRLDAVYAIEDNSPKHFLEELSEAVQNFSSKNSRKVYLIAEDYQNDAKIVAPKSLGGYGLDAQWLEDFHHVLHVILTGERQGYYTNFNGIMDLVKVFKERFVWSHFQNQTVFPAKLATNKFIIFSQNHDQIGNRPQGDRLITLAGVEAAKLAAALTIFSPYLPLLFMGEEYGEEDPFLFFTDYSNSTLARNVWKGRRDELSIFGGTQEIPDPQNPDTFKKSKLKWDKRIKGKNQKMVAFYKKLISLRRSLNLAYSETKVDVFGLNKEKLLFIRTLNTNSKESSGLIANLNNQNRLTIFPWEDGHTKILDSADIKWGGPGSEMPIEIRQNERAVISPFSLSLFVRKLS
jgi:maltooligosyltrehalose trehalohydrolase